MKNSFKLLCLISAVILTGCATIVGSRTQLMPLASTPSGATVSITDEKGVEIFKGQTPTTVTLEKSDGSYWGGKRYTVKIAKDGYDPQVIKITSSPNGWYLAGNLVFGGLIGWFIVDPLNGAMYTLSPKQINATLGKKLAYNELSDKAFSVVLLDDVPLKLRAKMVRIK